MINELRFPGVEDVLASFFLPVNMLIKEDLPTFDLPMKANSGSPSIGHFLYVVFDTKKETLFISIIQN